MKDFNSTRERANRFFIIKIILNLGLLILGTASVMFLSNRICVLSPHPGRLSAVVDVDLPYPRTIEMRDAPHFGELVSKVRNSFEGGSL